MLKHSVCWGLDLGHSSIKAVKIARKGEVATVLGYAIEPITVPEGGDRTDAVIAALRSLAGREEFHDTPVVASLSGRQVFSRTVNIPVINPKQVERMVELEARQQIPGDFDQVEWGYHLSPAPDGVSQDVALFAVKRELATEVMSVTRQAGINLVGISVSSLALYNFVRYDQVFPEDETIVILDVGAENTDLVCYQGDMLWMRTMGISGNALTDAFAKKFKVSVAEAETLKRQAGESAQADRILKVIEGTLIELTSEVQRSLGFYKQQNKDAKLENLVISGSTFRLPGLPEYMAERLRYTINILEDLDKVKVADGLEREHFMHDLQSLGVAMGLALQGIGFGRATVDLMPREEQFERLLRSKMWAGVAIPVALGATMWLSLGIVDGVKTENEMLLAKIKESYESNTRRQSESKSVLDQVAPKAVELKLFEPFGAQQGFHTGVSAAVLEVVQGIAHERGVIAGPPERGQPTPLQALYLRSLTIPEPDLTVKGPFRPLGTDVKVSLVVTIPQIARPGEISRLLVDRLKALPVPSSLLGLRADVRAARAANTAAEQEPRLFAAVQAQSETAGTDTYWYIDRSHTDPITGALAPLQEERRYPVMTVTIDCTLKAQETP